MSRTLLGAVPRLFGGILIGLATGITMFLVQDAIKVTNPLDWWHYFWIFAGIGGFSGATIGMAWAIMHVFKNANQTSGLSR